MTRDSFGGTACQDVQRQHPEMSSVWRGVAKVHRRHTRFRYPLMMVLVVVTLVLTSCAIPLPAPLQRAIVKAPAAFNGGVLDPARELPSFTLQRADGTRFNSSDTRGRVSLFFFGYTYCPDVCPLTLTQVAQVRQQLGADAGDVDVYFVTVDPERDTPERLLSYIAHFDPEVIPLTGTPAELAQARAIFGVVAEKRPVPESAAGYFVDHTAAIFLVDPESRIRLLYPHGVTPDDIVADIKLLLRDRDAAPARAAPTATPASDIRVEQAWARASSKGDGAMTRTSAVYMVIHNLGDQDDVLLGAHTEVANATEIHRSYQDNGVMRMRPAGDVVVPAGGTVVLEPGGLHVMLIDLRQDLDEGSQVQVTLRFERAGEVTVSADVRSREGSGNPH